MPERVRSRPGSGVAAVAAVAATYVYFLIFAEFAFLELVRAVAPERLRLVMAGLGAGGVLGAMGAARWYAAERSQTQLAWAFRVCAAAAGLALAARGVPLLLAAGVAAGLGLGAQTVWLAAGLRAALPPGRLGLGVGLGTGLAYALCNVPALFAATPRQQTAVALGVALAAGWLPRAFARSSSPSAPAAGLAGAVLARWVVVLLALVWMDSAAFFVIQHAPELRAATWEGAAALAANAGVHLGAAVVAGALLDRGWHGRIAALATLALAVACLVLNGRLPPVLPAAWWYTAGVSLYSTVLVDLPARSGRVSAAAWIYAVAGWIGSALGIGMAQDLASIPSRFVAVAAGTVAVALIVRWRAVTAGALVLAGGIATPGRSADAADAPVSLGREVYIAEGCMHCHSQFVRPRVASDVERWGPAAELGPLLRATPPLFGNRRQGPDLANVGNRRSPEWNRLHLQEPRAVSPGSRMPAYAYLFAPGDRRGDALVAYLASLGAETAPRRQEMIGRWTPRAGPVLPPGEARTRFVQLCAPCHGPEGRGDGPVAGRLSLRPPDWAVTPWRHVPREADAEVALARIIKFGLPGLPMAGHEYLPDGDVVGLARHLRALHRGGSPALVVASPP